MTLPYRIEDERLLRGRTTYVANLPREGAVHLAFVRSTVAHARILSVETAEAAASPGVVAVFAGAECDLPPIREFPMLNQDMVRYYLATDEVRFVGEAIAVVAAETEAQALDAAELVVVDYDPLPVVVDIEEAVIGDVLVHEAAGTNVAFTMAPSGEVHFEDCEVVVTQRMVNQRVAIAPMEGRSVLAEWDGDGTGGERDGTGDHLTVWISGQGPHPFRERLAPALGLSLEQLRVVHPDVGGGFGAKALPHPEEIVVPWVARRLGRPARWTESRTESMQSLAHGRGQVQYAELGGNRDGEILAYRLHVVQDCGAYPRLAALLPNMTRSVMSGVYHLPAAAFDAVSVVTNTNPIVAYRGAGGPESSAALERAVDLFAGEIGMDPVAVRRRNLIGADAFPYLSVTGLTYDTGDYGKCLDTALEALGYEDVRAEQRRRRERGDSRQLGIGLAMFVESTSSSNGSEWARVEVLDDGSVQATTGTSPHGQGHATTWAMLIERELGVPMDRIEVLHGDSEHFPSGVITGGSRSLQVGGTAMVKASVEVRETAAALAATLLEADVADIVFDREGQRFHVAGTPSLSITLAQAAVAAAEHPGDDDGGGNACLDAIVKFDPRGGTFASGAYIAVVEVDTETGEVDLQRMIAVDDAGIVMNHMIFHGQVHGGAAQGIGQALYEEVVYDPEGNLLTSTFADYALPSAAEFPSFEVFAVETPTPLNEMGVKGVGESGPVGATPAVQNAVVDAVSHLGVRHIDMPLTAERVWRAIREGEAG